MIKKNYQEALQITKQLLDMMQIDNWLLPSFKFQKDIHEIMDNIEDNMDIIKDNPKLKSFIEEHDDVFRGRIFNRMNSYEFQEYCEQRYPGIKWYTEIIEYTYITTFGE